MRITGGEHRGRILKTPKGGMRPTQDMVRSALFSMFASEIPGCVFMDMFAGSGAVGLEAVSRGAQKVVFVENHKRTALIIKQNISMLGVTDCKVFSTCALKFAKNNVTGNKYDIIFADPPYADKCGDESLLYPLLNSVANSKLLTDNGFFVMESSAHEKYENRPGWDLVTERKYGKTLLRVFKQEKNI